MTVVCEKRGYTEFTDALDGLRAIQIMRADRGDTFPYEQSIYRCQRCYGFHLTHQGGDSGTKRWLPPGLVTDLHFHPKTGRLTRAGQQRIRALREMFPHLVPQDGVAA